jgi:ubiquinone/menaquinone biosynthesis C-methylase UbiE
MHICPWWLSFFVSGPLRRLFHNPEKILRGLVRKGQVVADIGCGPGLFSIPLAKMVGEEGRVIAADIQEKMLEYVRRKAEKAGVASRIELHQSQRDKLGIKEQVDFALAFYMAHEVPDKDAFFKEIVTLLKTEAHFLLVEPKMHVSASRFQKTVDAAYAIGLKVESEWKVSFSRGVLFSLD